MHNREIGYEAEDLARGYLEENGYTILEQNYQNSHQEIDLIAVKDKTLVFVEVKSKKSAGQPEHAVNRTKQNNIARAAEGYLRKHNHEGEFRFDVIAIIKSKNEITHFTDVFFPSNKF